MFYAELMDCVKSSDASVGRASAIIERDMRMTAKVLQLTTQTLGGPKIGSIGDAVAYLGLDNIGTLLLTLNAFTEFEASSTSNFSTQTLWRHSLTTGALAERLLPSLPPASQAHGHIRIIGLLHDVGWLVLAANLPEDFDRVYKLVAEKQMFALDAEREVFGVTHAELGAALLETWGLPTPMIDAVAYHHSPGTCPHPGSAMLMALHVADVLESSAETTLHPPEPDLAYLTRSGVAHLLPVWRELSTQFLAKEMGRA